MRVIPPVRPASLVTSPEGAAEIARDVVPREGSGDDLMGVSNSYPFSQVFARYYTVGVRLRALAPSTVDTHSVE